MRRGAASRRHPSRGHQRVEEAPVAALLWMPLDADDETMAAELDGLDDAVLAPSGRDQTDPEFRHPLVVAAEDAEPLAEHPPDLAPLGGGDGYLAELARKRLVEVRPELVGQVLDEVPAQPDVQDLHPSTDREDRQVAAERGVEECELELVAGRIGPCAPGVGGLPVAAGLDVAAADQHERVEIRHQPGEADRCAGREPELRRDEQRLTTGGGHQVEVRTGDQRRVAFPRPPRGDLPVHRHPDEGARVGRRHGGQYPIAVPDLDRCGAVPTVRSPIGCGAGMDRLEGKVALITGAGSGIGKVTAERFAAEGAEVVVADLAVDEAEAVAAGITAAGGAAHAVGVDVADEDRVDAMVAAAVDTYGGLHVLVNNAGIFPADDGGVRDTPPATWQKVMEVNLKGVWLGCRAAIPAMLESGGGSIVNIASFVALMGAATAQVAYTASKGGVLALTREAAVEYARSGIRVNALCPGPIETPLLAELLADPVRRQRRLVHIPLGRFGRPEEIAAAALFLASDESSFVTGSALVVDGGITAAYVTPE